MRITGLGSGMDIDQMVKDLMKAHRIPYDKLFQQKTTLEWQRDQYREVSTKLVDFSLNKLFNYGLSGSMAAKTAVLSGNNTTSFTAKAMSGAATGSMSVKVTQLAEAASLRTSDAATKGLAMNNGSPVNTTMVLSDLATNSNLTYTNEPGQNGPKITVTVTTNGVASTKSIQLDEDVDTMASVLSKINTQTDVTAVLDSTTGKLSLTSKTMGANTTISVSGDFWNTFQLTTPTAGKNSIATVNGLTVTNSSNKVNINGVELNFNAVSTDTTTVTVSSDTDKIVDTIKSYIKDYNDVLGLLNRKTDEQRFRKFPPLTAEQKKDMSEDEIKLWEEKAKSGLLRRDSILEPLTANMRLATITSVTISGTKVNLTSLGITTGSYQDGGKLVIFDENKLRAAVEANPDQVMSLFTQKSSDKTPSAPDAGIFTRLSNAIGDSLNQLSKKAGTSRFSTDPNAAWIEDSLMSGQLKSIDRRMNDVNDRLTMLENQYYKQFTAMETALNKFNSQSGVLSNFGK